MATIEDVTELITAAGRHREQQGNGFTLLRSALGVMASRTVVWAQTLGVQPTPEYIERITAVASHPGAFDFGGALYDDGYNTDYVKFAQKTLAQTTAYESLPTQCHE